MTKQVTTITLWHGYIGRKSAIPKITHQINNPIIVFSKEKSEMINEAKKLGISDFFIKSISIDKLVPKIKFLLGEIVWEHHCNPH